MRMRFGRLVSVGALAAMLTSSRAGATYHSYRFAEVYSNPSGTIQFIELHEAFGASGQNFESEAPDIFAGGVGNIGNPAHDLTLTDLPSPNTANTFYLLGTAGYNAIPGAPKSDYIIPSNFFSPGGDSLQYGQGFGEPHPGPDGIVDQVTFGTLPTEPTKALQRQGTFGSTFTVGPAIANTFSHGGNFAVPEPSEAVALGALGVLAARRRRRSATV